MFQYSIIKNLTNKIIYDVARYVKRDSLEVRHIKEERKIKQFYTTSVQRSLDRVKRELLLHNKEYGIMLKDEIIVKSEINLYWRIEIVDDYENFVNNLHYWGICISLIDQLEKKVLSISYYMPSLDEYFYCSEGQGCFMNDRKLSLMGSAKLLIGTNTKKISNRILGSDILTILYCAYDKINLAVFEKNAFNEALARLIMNEVKGRFTQTETKVILGNETAVNSVL